MASFNYGIMLPFKLFSGMMINTIIYTSSTFMAEAKSFTYKVFHASFLNKAFHNITNSI